MLINASTLKGYALHGLDGAIGTVKQFYFDDQHWTIRYLVVDTGNWLPGRQVLISPYSLTGVNREEQQIGINLTKQQIEDSPAVGSDKPVSRQFEETYYRYYGWPMYWSGQYMWGTSFSPFIMPDTGQEPESARGDNQYGSNPSTGVRSSAEESRGIAWREKEWNPHLRSTYDVSGYHIQAEDGEIGHVSDFIIDDETWAIRYLLIDTVNWWPGKKVLVAARWIERVSWEDSKVFIKLSRAAIKQAPDYTEESLLTRDYESRLHGHYNRQGYWVDEPVAHEQSDNDKEVTHGRQERQERQGQGKAAGESEG